MTSNVTTFTVMKDISTSNKSTQLKHQDLFDLKKLIESSDVSSFDYSVLSKGYEIAVFYLKNGSVKFMDFSHQMLKDVGNCIRPFLKTLYSGLRYLPGLESLSEEMSSIAFVEKFDVNAIKQDNMFYSKEWKTAFGAWHATEFIKEGFFSIEDYAELMIKDFGDAIRPKIIQSYEQARTWFRYHGLQSVLEEMTSTEGVRAFDPDTFDKPFILRCNYYAPKEPGFLTIATHAGVLNKYDILENLALMGIMGEQVSKHGEVYARKALALRESLTAQELMDLAVSYNEYLCNPEWDRVWKANGLNPEGATTLEGEEIALFPIEEVLQEDWKPLTRVEAEEKLMALLEEQFFERLYDYI